MIGPDFAASVPPFVRLACAALLVGAACSQQTGTLITIDTTAALAAGATHYELFWYRDAVLTEGQQCQDYLGSNGSYVQYVERVLDASGFGPTELGGDNPRSVLVTGNDTLRVAVVFGKKTPDDGLEISALAQTADAIIVDDRTLREYELSSVQGRGEYRSSQTETVVRIPTQFPVSSSSQLPALTLLAITSERADFDGDGKRAALGSECPTMSSPGRLDSDCDDSDKDVFDRLEDSSACNLKDDNCRFDASDLAQSACAVFNGQSCTYGVADCGTPALCRRLKPLQREQLSFPSVPNSYCQQPSIEEFECTITPKCQSTIRYPVVTNSNRCRFEWGFLMAASPLRQVLMFHEGDELAQDTADVLDTCKIGMKIAATEEGAAAQTHELVVAWDAVGNNSQHVARYKVKVGECSPNTESQSCTQVR